MNITEFNGVSFGYGKNTVLKNFSLTIKKGEFAAVLGKNGSGKSTFARLINGLLTPDSGSVFTCGFNTSDERLIYEIRRRASFVFQNPDDGIVSAVVEDEAAFTAENLGTEPAVIRSRVDGALKRTGLYEKRLALTSSLSGGEKQRLAIASALVSEPELLILDEPTSMLDPEGRRDFFNLLKKLISDGITAVLVTHDMETAAHAGRCIVIDGGAVSFDGPPKALFSDRELLKKYSLRAPEMQRVADELKKRGVTIPDGMFDPHTTAEYLINTLFS